MKFQLNLTIWNHIEIHILREINLAIFRKAVCNSDSFIKWDIILFLLFCVPETLYV